MARFASNARVRKLRRALGIVCLVFAAGWLASVEISLRAEPRAAYIDALGRFYDVLKESKSELIHMGRVHTILSGIEARAERKRMTLFPGVIAGILGIWLTLSERREGKP